MTNFEKIKNMSVEELEDFLATLAECSFCPADCFNCSCDKAWMEWLESEVEE